MKIDYTQTPTETTHYIYNANDQLIAEYWIVSGVKVPKKEYFWAEGRLVGVFEYTYGPLNIEPYCVVTGHLGQPLIAFDDSASVGWKTWYKPFGETVGLLQPDLTLNLRLPGQYFDEETGLYYNWHRYYMPQIGRYLQADPMDSSSCFSMQPDQIQHYLHVSNNPLSNTDTMGLLMCGSAMDKCKKKAKCSKSAVTVMTKPENEYVHDCDRTSSKCSYFEYGPGVEQQTIYGTDVNCSDRYPKGQCWEYYHELGHVKNRLANENEAHAFADRVWDEVRRNKKRACQEPDPPYPGSDSGQDGQECGTG